MSKIIKNNLNLIIGIFIIIQPIIDLITGFCLNVFDLNVTFGILIRMLFLGFIMVITFIYKKKTSLIYYFIFLIYSLIYLTYNLCFKNTSIFVELQGLLRVFYFPLLLISLYDLKDEIKISKMTLVTTLFIYLISIFIPSLLNVGFNTYAVAKTGTLGFYNSANEISGIISITAPFIFIIFKEKKGILFKVLFALLYLIVILMIGTKTPLLSLLITIFLIFLFLIGTYLKDKKYKQIVFVSSLILIGLTSLIILLPKTNFYKNIQIHLDYLEVDNITDVFSNERLIDHFIFSERITFYSDKFHIYKDSDFYQKLFGIGYINDQKTTKLIEMDYFDIFYSHGLIGFIIFMIVPLYVLLKFALQKRVYNFDMYVTNISFLLIIFLSFFTGHIITAPAVSLLVVIIFLYLDCNRKKELLFTAYDLDLGGIETALINLLDNINYDKYNVTVILEQKRGIFLSKINKNVRIRELKVSSHNNLLIRKIINFTRKLVFTIFNYHNYDFSCCYATYSLSGNALARITSLNSSLYIHSNYKYVYKTEKEVRDFFDARNLQDFHHLIFVSNECLASFLELYPIYKEKCLVLNNFINVEKVLALSKEKIDLSRPKDKVLFVFIGRLDDSSKKLTRAINLIANIPNTYLWIVGDGPDREKYEREVNNANLNNRITFCFKQENPYPYLKQGDYLILTSDYEGFPVTYLEAIVLKVQIMTTIDVSDDEINIGKDYATIIPKEEEAMIRKVKETLKEKEKMKEINLEEIQKVRIKKLEKIFDEVV